MADLEDFDDIVNQQDIWEGKSSRHRVQLQQNDSMELNSVLMTIQLSVKIMGKKQINNKRISRLVNC